MKKIFCLYVLGIVYFLNSYGANLGIVNDFQFIEEQNKDTIALGKNNKTDLVQFHLEAADVHKNKGMYAVAYEHLWEALLLAKAENNYRGIAAIHNELGMLYGIYNKEDKAIEHKILTLKYIKKDTVEGRRKSNNLRKAYYSLAVQYRKAKNYDKSTVYLDSCLYVERNIPDRMDRNAYVFAEKGNLHLLQNNLKEAELFLIRAKQLLEEENRHYLVVVYSFLGDLYTKKNEVTKALYYYEKSLNAILVTNSHTDLKTDILQKIASIYKKQNKVDKAYYYLEQSTKIGDSLFGMRNKNNSDLFEIKNKYKEALVKKDAYINQQEDVIEKKKQIQIRLIFAIAIILFILIVLILLFYHKAKVKRLKAEKEKVALEIKHDKEKINVVLESKSKELTVSALQLIEKDKNIETLLEALKLNAPDTYRKIHKEIVRGNKDLWESFNLRFTEVNTDFYKRLRDKHDELTPTEQKHCALIKLKFDSKEMAKLLNISVNSVHISRHRIRKKIGLERGEDLSNYISSI
ncbi:tetratricopeptide (TPR) repeat protein [Wenyingzhuangia heitensis]|uniref:Tetratricopeptide (TPR) repeat protein n=1 Tax=Wenyingzhuangia heitensis TaxID=1487859 RepID=A0ABX0U5W1_9FLAO|nr:hypothetical protein [Wenyingzhuangia heitensis]NIJ44234.1 tetratricopeptide (TPR) repeat protein [Wenyingzhuangia heitensis]